MIFLGWLSDYNLRNGVIASRILFLNGVYLPL